MLEMLLSREGFNLQTFLGLLISSAAVIFFTLPVHEWAHGFVATKLGDPTPRYQGRLSLNPLKHIDYVGALCILLVGVGWAKPVQVDMRYFKNPKRDMAITAAAGPLMNLLVSFVLLLIYNFISVFVAVPSLVAYIVLYFVLININLAVFNLIPIPPFDGSRILSAFLPDRIYYKLMQYERIIFIIVLAFLFFGAGSGIVRYVSAKVFNFINWLAALPFSFL